MSINDAKEYAEKRMKELKDTPKVNAVNMIIQELAQYHKFHVVVHKDLPYAVRSVTMSQEGITYNV